MKKTFTILLILCMTLGVPVFAGMSSSFGGSVSANSTVKNAYVGGATQLHVFNDGSDSVYMQITSGADVVATNSDFYMLTNTSMVIDSKDIVKLSLICTKGNTATVRYFATR